MQDEQSVELSPIFLSRIFELGAGQFQSVSGATRTMKFLGKILQLVPGLSETPEEEVGKDPVNGIVAGEDVNEGLEAIDPKDIFKFFLIFRMCCNERRS